MFQILMNVVWPQMIVMPMNLAVIQSEVLLVLVILDLLVMVLFAKVYTMLNLNRIFFDKQYLTSSCLKHYCLF